MSSKAGFYLKVGWAGRPSAVRPAIHWEETPLILAVCVGDGGGQAHRQGTKRGDALDGEKGTTS